MRKRLTWYPATFKADLGRKTSLATTEKKSDIKQPILCTATGANLQMYSIYFETPNHQNKLHILTQMSK